MICYISKAKENCPYPEEDCTISISKQKQEKYMAKETKSSTSLNWDSKLTQKKWSSKFGPQFGPSETKEASGNSQLPPREPVICQQKQTLKQ